MSGKVAWVTVKTAFRNFGRDNVVILSAALAFFAMLSLAPLLVLLLTVTGWLGQDTQQRIIQRAESMVGPQASEMIGTIIQQVEGQQELASTAALIGLVGTLIAATGAFTHLQYSLNRIFKVRLKKQKGFIFTWLWTRLLALLMILAIAAVLIASVVVTSAISMALGQSGPVWQIVNVVLSAAVFSLAFMVMFKVLPDVVLSWGSALMGGIITGVLFLAGQYGISQYLARAGAGSAFGAAGSLAVLLVWMFYSAIVVFLGAELTHAYVSCCGRKVTPDRHAELTEEAREVAREQEEMMHAHSS
jgi:membrane protein